MVTATGDQFLYKRAAREPVVSYSGLGSMQLWNPGCGMVARCLTNLFLHQTVRVLVGITLVVFPNIIGMGVGGELFGRIR